LPEWVASDDADFVRRAVALSQDRKALLKLKKNLRKRLSALPAWDIDAYALDLQKAVRNMWVTWVDAQRSGGGTGGGL
jgi:predicted O-linked N-acetylglucosamine transferase (SPINDLY family)